jgi:hypothetical protein
LTNERGIPQAIRRYSHAGVKAEGAGVLPYLVVTQQPAVLAELERRGVTTLILVNTGRNIDPATYQTLVRRERLGGEIVTADALAKAGH